MQTGTPWQEVASVAEAEALTGFGLVLPEAEAPYTEVLDSEALELGTELPSVPAEQKN